MIEKKLRRGEEFSSVLAASLYGNLNCVGWKESEKKARIMAQLSFASKAIESEVLLKPIN